MNNHQTSDGRRNRSGLVYYLAKPLSHSLRKSNFIRKSLFNRISIANNVKSSSNDHHPAIINNISSSHPNNNSSNNNKAKPSNPIISVFHPELQSHFVSSSNSINNKDYSYSRESDSFDSYAINRINNYITPPNSPRLSTISASNSPRLSVSASNSPRLPSRTMVTPQYILDNPALCHLRSNQATISPRPVIASRSILASRLNIISQPKFVCRPNSLKNSSDNTSPSNLIIQSNFNDKKTNSRRGEKALLSRGDEFKTGRYYTVRQPGALSSATLYIFIILSLLAIIINFSHYSWNVPFSIPLPFIYA